MTDKGDGRARPLVLVVDDDLNTRILVRECLEQALDILAPQAAAKGLDLAYLADRDVPEVVVGDAMRLRQILVNLVGNAIKFTDDGQVVMDVRCCSQTTDGVEIECSVTDTGIENLHFDLFHALFAWW